MDTSSLIHAGTRAYPPKSFPALWAAIDGLIEAGRLLATIEVLHELQRKDDDLCAWAKDRKEELFKDIDDPVQEALVHVMTKHPGLVNIKTGKSGADPFVVAQAMVLGPGCCVVTEEKPGTAESPKIPYVCRQEGIQCINLVGLIELEGWTF